MEKKDDFYISEELAEWMGLKKSEYLSKLIQNAGPDDIPLEQYHLFDQYLAGTLEVPDRTMEFTEDGYVVRTYLRTYQGSQNFHQIVIGVISEDPENKSKVFIPIMSFVSNDGNLVNGFCAGEVVSRPTLN